MPKTFLHSTQNLASVSIKSFYSLMVSVNCLRYVRPHSLNPFINAAAAKKTKPHSIEQKYVKGPGDVIVSCLEAEYF